MPTWVGDAALATPLIEALHERYPDVPKDFLIKPYLRGLLDDAPWLGRVYEMSRGAAGFWSLRTALARRRYDWGILLPNSLRPAILLRLAGVRRRIGYARNGRGPLLTDRLRFPDTRGRTVPFRMVDFYGAIGTKLELPDSRGLKLYAREEIRAAAGRLLRDHGVTGSGPVIGLNPGAKYGSSKLWPVEAFAMTGDALATTLAAQIVVMAGPGEDELAAEIVGRMSAHAVMIPSAGVNIEMLKGVVSRLDLLITNDTGPRHIAAAFGVPTVALFGPTHTVWGDSGFEKSVELFIEVECGPCMKRTCPLGHHKCMTGLEPAAAIAAAETLLRRYPPSRRRGPDMMPAPS